MFIQLHSRHAPGWVNSDHIVSVAENAGVTTLTMSNGDTITGELVAGGVHVFPSDIGAIVPAVAGYETVTVWDPSSADEAVERYPVLAWRVTSFGAEPVTLESAFVDHEYTGVLLPSGEVHSANERCATLDEFVDRCRESSKRKAG